MAFADETDQWRRWFTSGWRPRAETAEEIARRLQVMVRELRRCEPGLNPLWLPPSSRALRPTDPGPIDEMALDDLARLIDRRCRFDPPPLPAPVGPGGYSLYPEGPPSLDPACRVDITIRAGATNGAWPGNGCILNFLHGAPLWQSTERGLAVLRAMVQAWEPDGAGAYARQLTSDDEPHDPTPHVRPWITWDRDGGNYEFYKFIGVGNPQFVHSEHGGVLRVWP
jgi:hypothetical protein